MVVKLAPQLVGLALGHFALRTPILLLGALDGTQTVTAAMAAVRDATEARSPCRDIRRRTRLGTDDVRHDHRGIVMAS